MTHCHVTRYTLELDDGAFISEGRSAHHTSLFLGTFVSTAISLWLFCRPSSIEDFKFKIMLSRLLLIPLELRRRIFWYSLFWNRHPTPEAFYVEQLSGCWGVAPSPLLRASKQTRGEVIDLLRNEQSFTLRVTPYRKTFDSLGASCIVAQNRPSDLSGLPELVIELWAPYPKRSFEVICIWKHVRHVCGQLREVGPPPKLTIRFLDNSLAQWCVDGKSRYIINEGHGWRDVEQLVTLFGYVYGVSVVQIDLPPSMRPDFHLREWFDRVIETIKKREEDPEMVRLAGCANIEYDQKIERFETGFQQWLEEDAMKGDSEMNDDQENDGDGDGGKNYCDKGYEGEDYEKKNSDCQEDEFSNDETQNGELAPP